MSRVPRQEQIEEKRKKRPLRSKSCELGKRQKVW